MISKMDSEIEKHSSKAVELIRRFVAEPVELPDGCAELFLFAKWYTVTMNIEIGCIGCIILL